MALQYKHNNLFKKPVTAGDVLVINDKEFQVRGILKPIGNPGDDRLIYMSLEDFRPLFNITKRIDTIVVQVNNEEQLLEIAERVEKKLRTSRGLTEKDSGLLYSYARPASREFWSYSQHNHCFFNWCGSHIFACGRNWNCQHNGCTSVLERTKEIGVMKSVGAKNSDITLIFLIESGLLGLVGELSELCWALALDRLLNTLPLIGWEQHFFRFLRHFGFYFVPAVCFSLLARLLGTLPALRAAKINLPRR